MLFVVEAQVLNRRSRNHYTKHLASVQAYRKLMQKYTIIKRRGKGRSRRRNGSRRCSKMRSKIRRTRTARRLSRRGHLKRKHESENSRICHA